MNLLFSRDVAALLVLSFGHFLWLGLLIALVAAFAAKRQPTADARYRVWVLGFLAMAISPAMTFVLMELMPRPSRYESESTIPTVADDAQATATQNRVDAEIETTKSDGALSTERREAGLSSDPTSMAEPRPARSEPGTRRSPAVWRDYSPIVIRLYLIGVALMVLRLSLGLWGGRRLRCRTTLITEASLLAALRRQATRLGLKLVPGLATCESVAVPTVLGIIRPMILLPASVISGLSPEQVESVLAHELAHLRRYDHLVNLAQCVIESLLFFHPAIWWISRRIREEREHCCDDLVVASGTVPLDYAASLLRVAEIRREAGVRDRQSRSLAGLGLFATGRPSTLRQRISRLLGHETDHSVRTTHPWILAGLAGACIGAIWLLTVMTWSALAQIHRNREFTTIIVEWSAIVDESVLREIRSLHNHASDPTSITGAETLRCTAKELHAILRSRLNDPQRVKVASSIQTFSPADNWGRGIRSSTRAEMESIPVGDDFGSVLSVAWHRDGTATLDAQGEEVHLRVEAKYNCQLEDVTPVTPSGSFDETLADGDAMVVMVTPPEIPKVIDELADDGSRLVKTQQGTWKLTAIFVHEAMRIPAAQVADFHPLPRTEGWLRRGASGWKDHLQRITHWHARSHQEFATVHKIEWTRELPHGGTIELLAVGQPETAPNLWWDPSGMPISGSDPAWSGHRTDELMGIVRVAEAGVERCPATVPGIATKPYDSRMTQFASLPIRSDRSPEGRVVFRVGAGLGPWQESGHIPMRDDATMTINGIELRVAKLFDFAKRGFRVLLDCQTAPEFDADAVAVTKAGKVIVARRIPTVASYEAPRRFEFDFKIRLADIDHLILKTRPLHWVKFTEFALEPALALDPPVAFATPHQDLPAVAHGPAAGRTDSEKTAAHDPRPTGEKPAVESAPKPDQYVANLPGGLQVELVGITKNTEPAARGWKPDGRPIGDVGYWPATTYRNGHTSGSFTENGEHPAPNAQAIDLLFRFRGLTTQPSLTFSLATDGTSYSHLPVKDPYQIRVTTERRGPPPPGSQWSIPDGEMRVGLTDEPWGKWLQIATDGQILNPMQEGDLYRSYYNQLDVKGVQPHERAPNKIALVLVRPKQMSSDFNFEIRGIDPEGESQWVLEWEGRGIEGTELIESRWGLASPEKKPLERFEFRLRPYRHWVTFEGVSLHPGQESDVKVSVKSIPPE